MHDEFLKWCDERITEHTQLKARLTADGRGDEANFTQIRLNVLNIFRTTYTALGCRRDLLLDRLDSIPAAWAKSLAQAMEHGADERAHVERIKLETAAAIRHFAENMEAKEQ